MTGSYTKARRELAEQSDENRLRCLRCGAATLRETMSQYGGRCFACYEAYCAEPRRFPDTGTKGEPRSWAHALKRRHDAGEELSAAQVSAYQAALRARPGESA